MVLTLFYILFRLPNMHHRRESPPRSLSPLETLPAASSFNDSSTTILSSSSSLSSSSRRNLTPIKSKPLLDQLQTNALIHSNTAPPVTATPTNNSLRKDSWLAHLHGATPPPDLKSQDAATLDQQSLLSMLRSIWMSSDSVERTIDKAVTMAYKFVHAERITMFLVDASSNELVLSTSKDARGLRMPLTAGLAGHVASTGEILNISDPYSDKRFNQNMDKSTGFKTRNLIVIPIMDAENCVVAVLQGVNRVDTEGSPLDSFSSKDIDVLRAMGDSIGVAIKKAQMHQVVMKEKRNVEALFNLMKAVHADEGIIDLRTLTDVILSTAKHLLTADTVELYLISPLRDELYIAPGNKGDYCSEDIKSNRIPMGSGIPGRVAAQGGAIVVTRLRSAIDAQQATIISEMPNQAHSAVCMPVTTKMYNNPNDIFVDPNNIEAVIFGKFYWKLSRSTYNQDRKTR